MRRSILQSTAMALLASLPMFGCISDSEPDMVCAQSIAFKSEHASKAGDAQREYNPRAQTHRVWETAAGELVFNSGETFNAMTSQRQGLSANSGLEGKPATTDKDKEIAAE